MPSVPLPLVEIEKKALRIREHVISMLLSAGSGHSAGSLDLADVFASLFFGGVVEYDPKKPWVQSRDRVLLSNGHVCPVWYATLAEAGYFSKEELKTLRKLGSGLQGHPILKWAPGVENTSGSLGQGLSQASGIALAAKLKQQKFHVWCVVGDGELEEGSNWEALWFAAVHRLHNLTVIVDRNNIQSEGYTEDILPLEPLTAKFEAFGWKVLEVDGHNVEAIIDVCNQAKAILEKPTVIIAHTIAGKGVEYMEGEWKWHAKAPNKAQALEALRELKSLKGKIHND